MARAPPRDRGGPRGLYSAGRRPQPIRSRGTNPINTISALLAIAIGVVHAGLATVTAGSDLRPNLILGAVVSVTILFGLGPGTVWAFVGGLTANLLTTDPLGSVPLGLLLVAALTAGVVSVIGRSGVLVALALGVLGSLVLDVTALLVLLLLGAASPAQPAALVSLVLPAAVANGVLTVLVWAGTRAVVARVSSAPAVV